MVATSKKFEKEYFVQAIFLPSQTYSVLNSSKICPRKAPNFKWKVFGLQAWELNKPLEWSYYQRIELQEDIADELADLPQSRILATIMVTKAELTIDILKSMQQVPSGRNLQSYFVDENINWN
jgi:hypothetical protein